jgi:hypothetical protein
MILHPALHLEIARQRQQQLLAEAESYRIGKSCDHLRVSWLAPRWPLGRKRSPALQDGGRSMALQVGFDQ